MRSPLALVVVSLVMASAVLAQPTPTPATGKPPAQMNGGRPRLSPHDKATANIDGSLVTISYGRPHIRDPKSGAERSVWGGKLVPPDAIWRTGADEATLLNTEKAIVFGTTTVPAGVYSLFTYYAADGSAKLVVNKKTGQWGIGKGAYDESLDLAKIPLTKSSLESQVEQFTIVIDKGDVSGGVIKMMWASTQYSVPFTVAK